MRNAINRATAVAIAGTIDELDDRPEHIVGAITGRGGTFSAGLDLKTCPAGEDNDHQGTRSALDQTVAEGFAQQRDLLA